MKCVLYLEDGTLLVGKHFGAKGTRKGEIIFNTGLTGYQEILTDPSYKEQIVVMTYPHIGNYGVNWEDVESRKPFLEGFVVREAESFFSNWRAKKSLWEYLEENGVVGIYGVDTRFLTRKIRDRGAMKAIITTEDVDEATLRRMVDEYPGLVGRDIVKDVTCNEPYDWDEELWFHPTVKYEKPKKRNKKVVVLDFGVKYNILRNIALYFKHVRVVPAYTDAEKILSENPDGVVLSNGPGDPAPLKSIHENIKKIVGKVPILAICLGHQNLALALGAKTYKLKFGHHGINHPVKNILTGKVEITSQNHGFAVNPDTFPEDVRRDIKLSHVSLNDGTFEGYFSPSLKFISVQYHPEAGPGPSDSRYLFEYFANLVDGKPPEM